jgi:hypothetical protein
MVVMKPERWHIRIRGHIGAELKVVFEPLDVTNRADGACDLTGCLPDQAALHGVLETIRDLGIALVFVQPLDSSTSGDH